MRIMILANNDAGLYKFRLELLEELVKNHEVLICLPDGDYIENMVELGCQFIPCTCLERQGANPLKDLALMKFYKNALKQHKPDIVFTYTIKPNSYGGMVCGMLKIPYVANITGLGTAIENESWMQKIALTIYKTGLRKAQKVFFQNTANRDFMVKKNVLKGPYDLLPGSGVNLSRYEVSEYPSKDTVDFVFVGRMMKEKGIENYMEATEYIRAKYPETRFHICGSYEQDYRERLEKLQQEGVVIYHGIVKDMVAIYKEMSCTIHPSYYPEGLSNVLLESSACGRPIITTDRAGCKEVIDDGKNGFICKQNNTKDLIQQIEKFLALSREERKQMGLAGRAKVEKEFNRQIVIEKYLAELNRE